MKRKLKILMTAFLIIVFGLGLIGCKGNTNTGNASGSDASGKNEIVNLKLWLPAHSDDENATLEKIFQDFNSMHDGEIKVEYEFIPRGNSFAYEDKISAAVTSNSLADIIMIDGPNITNYAYSGIIQPIGDYISDEEKADFVDSVITQGTYDGELYALAPTESTVALFYNKDITDTAGLTLPTELSEAWTWDEFLNALKKVHKEGEINGLNIHPENGTGEWMTYMPTPFVWANDGRIISEDGLVAEGYINGQASVEGMKYFQEICKYANWQATPTEFEEGKAAFTINGSWAVPGLEKNYQDLNWGITYFPHSKTPSSPSGDWSFGVSAKSEHPEEAAKLISFITSTDSIVDFSNASGKPPAKKSSFEKLPQWDEYPRSVLKAQVLNTAHPRPITPAYPVLTQEYASAAVDIVLGADSQERLDQAAVKIEENLDRYFK